MNIDEFPDMSTQIFESLLLFINRRLKVLGQHEQQKKMAAMSTADRDATRLRQKWASEADVRATQLGEFTKKSSRLFQTACYAEVNRRAVSRAAAQSSLEMAGDVWRKTQELLCDVPSPWYDVPLGRALGLNLRKLETRFFNNGRPIGLETRFQVLFFS
jgi:hypothetical protein